MKNIKKSSVKIFSWVTLSILFAATFSSFAAYGQTGQIGSLTQDQNTHRISNTGNSYTDYTIPSAGSLPFLQLVIRGGDGGKAWIEALKGFHYETVRTGNGGQGATLFATFRIGTGSEELKPGGKLRTIVGRAGDSGRNCHGCIGQHGAGGGGGTGVLYLPAGADETTPSNWKILLVAGGGGGGSAGTGGADKHWDGVPGQITAHGYIDKDFWPYQYDLNGTTTTYGAAYLGYHGVNLSIIFGYSGYGGIDTEHTGGGGGTSPQTWKQAAGGAAWGDGIKFAGDSDPTGSPDQLMGETQELLADANSLNVGGSGLFQNVNGKILPIGGIGGQGAYWGGYGFGGGGGAGKNDYAAGGGGGGYSGGWAGNDYIGSNKHFGGNGGGSYVNENFAVPGAIIKIKNGVTGNPGGGYIDYQFSNATGLASCSFFDHARPSGSNLELLRSGTYRLMWQGDGNLVLYNGSNALWATGTNGKGATELAFQGDGNMVIYAGSNAIWSSGTPGKGGKKLVLLPGGHLCIVDANNQVLWARN